MTPGVRQLPGVGHLLPPTAAQLHLPAPDPFRAARVRVALPGNGGANARGIARRSRPRHRDTIGGGEQHRRTRRNQRRRPEIAVASFATARPSSQFHGRTLSSGLLRVGAGEARRRPHCSWCGGEAAVHDADAPVSEDVRT